MADVIDALIAEALGEGPEGIAAVAHVIATRAAQTGKTPEQVINEAGQFSGVSNPGKAVAAAMQDPSVRAQVQQVWDGVQSGSVPNPFPGADHFHTPQVSPSWSSVFDRAGQLGNHIFYSSGKTPAAREAPTPMPPIMRSANAASAAIEEAAPTGADYIRYANSGATRSLPLSEKLSGALSFLPDLGVTMEVFSGGQAPDGPRVGSTRHDHGDAADVYFYQNGERLDWANPEHQPIFEEIVRRGKDAGITGFGAGEGYMRPGSMHIGFGAPAVWGAGGKGANAPAWLRNAYYSATPKRTNAMAYAPQPAVMRAPGKGNFWAPLTGPIRAGLAATGIQPTVMRAANRAMPSNIFQVPMPIRNAVMSQMMQQNIGSAPTVTQGHGGAGTRAYAVTSGGSAPVMLAGSGNGGGNSPQGDGRNPAGQNMDIYRANAAVLGGNGFTQQNINKALSEGKTLYKLA